MSGYELGMLVRGVCEEVAAVVCWLVKLAVVLGVMLAPAALEALMDYYFCH